MNETLLDTVIAKLTDDDKIKTLDLTKLEDLNEYLEACEKIRQMSFLKMLFEIFDENFDEFIENLKTIGYKKYNENRDVEREDETCECKNCACGTCVCDEEEHIDDEWNYNKTVEIGDYGLALDEHHFPVYMGRVTYNDDVKFTLAKPVKFIDENGTEIEKLPFEEMTLIKSVWILDTAMPDEIDIYEGRDPFADLKTLPSYGLRDEIKNEIAKAVNTYMEKNETLFEEGDEEYVYDILYEYTAYQHKQNLFKD